MAEKKKHIKRKIKWIRPDIQLRTMLTLLLICTVVIAVEAQLIFLGIWNMLGDASQQESEILGVVSLLILKSFFIALLFGICFSIFLGEFIGHLRITVLETFASFLECGLL